MMKLKYALVIICLAQVGMSYSFAGEKPAQTKYLNATGVVNARQGLTSAETDKANYERTVKPAVDLLTQGQRRQQQYIMAQLAPMQDAYRINEAEYNAWKDKPASQRMVTEGSGEDYVSYDRAERARANMESIKAEMTPLETRYHQLDAEIEQVNRNMFSGMPTSQGELSAEQLAQRAMGTNNPSGISGGQAHGNGSTNYSHSTNSAGRASASLSASERKFIPVARGKKLTKQ
jgi:hypothetical protein